MHTSCTGFGRWSHVPPPCNYTESSKQIRRDIISFIGMNLDFKSQMVHVYKCKHFGGSGLIKPNPRESSWLNGSVTQWLTSGAKNKIKSTVFSCGVFMSVGNQTQSTANCADWTWRQKLPQILFRNEVQDITTLGEIFSHMAAFLFCTCTISGKCDPRGPATPYLMMAGLVCFLTVHDAEY